METDTRNYADIARKIEVSGAIKAMLDCMMDVGEKHCRLCEKSDACSFLTEAVFAYRYKKTIRDPLPHLKAL
ncbi:MAG: hypothetical protein ISR96_05480 [Nitrospira sp.]|nr:hypothetical protein [bacterium]MBL7048950.1 hypothetical protein [Nitrospira sp.]